jgi:preprotein translocase subunit SecB
MKSHPVNLKQVYFTRMVIESIPEHVMQEQHIKLAPPENTINLEKLEEESNSYIVVMKTILNKKKSHAEPYYIDIECVGTFDCESTLPIEEQLKAVSITGHSVVYGAIREAVSWVTGRHPFGPITLGLSIMSPQNKPEEPPTT